LLYRLAFAVGVVAALPAHAVPEASLPARYEAEILPFAASSESGSFKGSGDASVAFRVFRTGGSVRGSIVLLPGYTESYTKYGELAFDLTQAGFDLFAMDHRGMGHSQRLAANPQIVHVQSFDDYVADAELFVRHVVSPRQRGPLFLLGHSMGGLVGSGLLGRTTAFKAAAFSAPLYEMDTRSFPEWLAYLAVSFNVWRGVGADYAPGRTDFDPKTYLPEESWTTTSLARAKLQQAQWLAEPILVQGGPSNQWVREAILATWQRDELAAKVGVPVLILAAEDERYVKPAGQQDFCERAKQCKLVPIGRGSRHELLMERDEIRDEVLKQILAHFGA
jgi:lysophospholipase